MSTTYYFRFYFIFFLFLFIIFYVASCATTNTTTSTTTTTIKNTRCRSYCGNLTVDYPFSTISGCGHPGFRDLLFCVNEVLMFHLSSASYRVLQFDYSFHSLTLHDPHMSTCTTTSTTVAATGLVLDSWRTPYLSPAGDNVFLLLSCSPRSPLFQGFPEKRLPCRNISGMGCEEFSACPGWSRVGGGGDAVRCCAVGYEEVREINLTKLECGGYSSAYSVAPVRVAGPWEWKYGIRMEYSVPGDSAFCRGCEASGGTCGYDGTEEVRELCMCGTWNSTSNCDSANYSSSDRLKLLVGDDILPGLLTSMILWMATIL